RFDINEGRGHLAPVAKFQRPFAQAAAGDDHDGVGSAAIDFDKGDDALTIFALRIFEAELAEAEHGQAHAEYLARAKMAMGDCWFLKILVESLHCGPSSSVDSGCASAPREWTTKLAFSAPATNVTRVGCRSHLGGAQVAPVNSFLRTGFRLPS